MDTSWIFWLITGVTALSALAVLGVIVYILIPRRRQDKNYQVMDEKLNELNNATRSGSK